MPVCWPLVRILFPFSVFSSPPNRRLILLSVHLLREPSASGEADLTHWVWLMWGQHYSPCQWLAQEQPVLVVANGVSVMGFWDFSLLRGCLKTIISSSGSMPGKAVALPEDDANCASESHSLEDCSTSGLPVVEIMTPFLSKSLSLRQAPFK